MEILENPYRASVLPHPDLEAMPWTASDEAAPKRIFDGRAQSIETPLHSAQDLAHSLGIAALHIKDERGRGGLGSFKALGAAYVIACDAALGKAKGQTYVTASAGNHGLSLAAGAAEFGANARVYIAQTVPEGFAQRLRAYGAQVVRQGAVYEESMHAAAHAAKAEGLTLLSDSSWPGYSARPHRLMEGYLILMAEAVAQIPMPPTHIFLQAGVGGLAGACAAHARAVWGDVPKIIVVEPEAAPALAASIRAGKSVIADGPVSAMGRLDCKEPSLIALKSLSRDADLFQTITEAEGEAGADCAARAGYASTPSGAAGFAGVMAATSALMLKQDARALIILSEAAEDA
ncbi:MAG: pyridoxal-phosphate dependent enzyme [Paracoccaceae bacterium]